MTDPALLFGETLSEVAEAPYGLVRNRADLTELLFRRLHEKGLTIAQCADRRVMNRAVSTLQGYARKFDLAFPDYVPMKLRPKSGSANG
jgi:hypothetical protein